MNSTLYFTGQASVYVCGNVSTLDIGTAEVMPLLSAYIEEGLKLAQKDLHGGYQEEQVS